MYRSRIIRSTGPQYATSFLAYLDTIERTFSINSEISSLLMASAESLSEFSCFAQHRFLRRALKTPARPLRRSEIKLSMIVVSCYATTHIEQTWSILRRESDRRKKMLARRIREREHAESMNPLTLMMYAERHPNSGYTDEQIQRLYDIVYAMPLYQYPSLRDEI